MLVAMIIITGVAAFIALLLALRVHILFKIDGEVQIYVKVLFLKIKMKKSSERIEKEAEKEAEKQIKEPDGVSFKKMAEKHGTVKTIGIIFDTFKIMFEKTMELLGHTNIDRLDLTMSVSAGDAAETAVAYGVLCSVFYPFIGLISTKINIRNPKFNIFADYENRKIGFFAEGDLNVRVYYVVKVLLRTLLQYMKNTISMKK